MRKISTQTFQPNNPPVHTKKTSFMQRVQDNLRNGYTLYIQGETALKTLPFTTARLAARYPVNLTRSQAHRRHQGGHGKYAWLGWYNASNGLVHWLVMLNPGREIDNNERWRNPIDDPIRLTGYKVIRRSRPASIGLAGTQPAKSSSWTWCYGTENFERICFDARQHIAQRRDQDLAQLIHVVWKSPGFSGVREQVKKLRDIINTRWSRIRSKNEEAPAYPKVLGYVSRLKDVMVPWSQLMQENPNVQDETRDGPGGIYGASIPIKTNARTAGKNQRKQAGVRRGQSPALSTGKVDFQGRKESRQAPFEETS